MYNIIDPINLSRNLKIKLTEYQRCFYGTYCASKIIKAKIRANNMRVYFYNKRLPQIINVRIHKFPYVEEVFSDRKSALQVRTNSFFS